MLYQIDKAPTRDTVVIRARLTGSKAEYTHEAVKDASKNLTPVN